LLQHHSLQRPFTVAVASTSRPTSPLWTCSTVDGGEGSVKLGKGSRAQPLHTRTRAHAHTRTRAHALTRAHAHTLPIPTCPLVASPTHDTTSLPDADDDCCDGTACVEVEFDSADPSEATTGMHCLDSSYQKYTLRNGACGVPSFVIFDTPVTNGDWCGQALDWSTDPTYIEADQAKCKGGSNKTTYLMC